MKYTIVWFRLDLRLQDNPALNYALNFSEKIIPIFIFDPNINQFSNSANWFYHQAIIGLYNSFANFDIKLNLFYGQTEEILTKLCADFYVDSILWNRVYDKRYIKRDSIIKTHLTEQNIKVKSFNSSLLIDPLEYSNGEAFKYFQWEKFRSYFKNHKFDLRLHPIRLNKKNAHQFINCPSLSWDELNSYNIPQQIENNIAKYWEINEQSALAILNHFSKHDTYASELTKYLIPNNKSSFLSVYLKFGMIDPQRILYQMEQTKIDQPSDPNKVISNIQYSLLYRDYCFFIFYFNQTITNNNWDQQFDSYPYSAMTADLFNQLKNAITGIPIIDATINQMKDIGWIDYQQKLLLANFIIKLLNISWQEGIKLFELYLLDYDPVINALNWQSIAGSGPHLSPILFGLDPLSFSQKNDPQCIYIKHWLKQLVVLSPTQIHNIKIPETVNYPKALIDVYKQRTLFMERFNNFKLTNIGIIS